MTRSERGVSGSTAASLRARSGPGRANATLGHRAGLQRGGPDRGTPCAALAAQTDPTSTLLVVDNGSTDGTAELARRFAAPRPFPVQVLTEPEKGVGCAVDTGFRHAIAPGRTLLARTDADCLPRARLGGRRPGGADGRRRAGLSAGSPPAPTSTGRSAGRSSGCWWRSPRLRPAPARQPGRRRVPRALPDARRQQHGDHRRRSTWACGGMPRRPSPTDRTFLNRVRRSTAAIVHSRPWWSRTRPAGCAAYGSSAPPAGTSTRQRRPDPVDPR